MRTVHGYRADPAIRAALDRAADRASGGHFIERVIGACFGIALGLWAVGYAIRYGFRD